MPADPRRTPASIALVGLIVALLVGYLAGAQRPGDAGAAAQAPTATPTAPAGSPPPSAAASAAPTASPTPDPPSSRFGVVDHLLWGTTDRAIRDLDAIAAAGLGVVRFDVSWRNTEPEPGATEGIDRLDAVMDAIAQRGMRPIVTVIETPDWANGGRGRWTPPDDPGTYARFVGWLAARYARTVEVAWEIWNEPNDPRFWAPAPDPAGYAALLARAAAAIRGAAPSAVVLGGSILYGDSGFLQDMYDAGAAGTFDGLAVHPYAQNRAPADTGDPYHSFAGTLDRLAAVMADNGDAATPMWITEAGWSERDGVDEATRGRYLAEAVSMVAERPGIEVFAAYVFGEAVEPGYGLAASGPGSIAFGAYRDAVGSGASVAGPSSP